MHDIQEKHDSSSSSEISMKSSMHDIRENDSSF